MTLGWAEASLASSHSPASSYLSPMIHGSYEDIQNINNYQIEDGLCAVLYDEEKCKRSEDFLSLRLMMMIIIVIMMMIMEMK